MSYDYDVIVVGSGAAGAAAAWQFCRAGYSVACLERGAQLNPEKYPSTGADWEIRKQSEFSPLTASRDSKYDYPIEDKESPIAVCNFNGVGGSTILYSGHFPRFLPNDFNLYSNEGIYQDWPIEYQELRPFFELNERELNVAGMPGDPMYPDIDDLLPAVPLGRTGEKIARAFNALDWHWWPSYSAISTKATNGREQCINLGPCNTGCPQGAKSSADITYISAAKNLGLKLLPECAVDSVIVKNAKAVGVNYFDKHGTHTQLFANKVVLAGSAVGTPRILLNSISEENGKVGKNLMIHPLGYVEGVFSEPMDTHVGPQGCMLYSLEHYRNQDADFNLGYMMHVLRGTGPLETAQSALSRKKLKFGTQLEQDFFSFYRKQLSISIICEDLPVSSNYLELSEQRDRFGTPGVKIHYTLSENTKEMMKHGMTNAKKVLKEAGAVKTYAYGPVRNTGWHLMGTCKMGEEASTSVINPEGQCHDVKNLFIVDSSCFVTGSCVNPANTIQALSLYLADKIIKNDS